MIPFQGLLFFYCLGLLLIPAIVLGLLGKQIKYYGLLVTVVLLTWIFAENGQLIHLAVFYLWQTGLCMMAYRFFGKNKWLLRLCLILALLPLAVVKIGEVAPALHGLRLLGVSYMTFRSVQVLLDIHDGKTKDLNLLCFSYFLLFFPSVSSGPIDRYGRFAEDIDRKMTGQEYYELLRQGVWKLAFGALSSIAIGGLTQELWLTPLPDTGFVATLSYMYGYTFFLFFNFAGYSSMAIGVSCLLGVKAPENFRMPFLSVDMKDFWSRWHISLSTWLRDYLYSRFVRSSLKAKRFRNPRTASYLGYLLNMMTMGVWHGLTPAYLVYGAYHGLLMCLNEALDLHWKPFRKWKQGGWPQVLCAVVTFHLFSFGLLFFSGRIL